MATKGAPESKPADEKTKTRKLMRFWVIGTFIITFVAVTVFAGTITGFLILKEPLYWIMMIIAGLASAAVLVFYEWWLKRH